MMNNSNPMRPNLIISSFLLRSISITAALFCFAVTAVIAQSSVTDSAVIVQPGAPGQATKVLPASTRAVLPQKSAKDVEFMQGMIMHHAQAVEMVALIESRTNRKDVRLLGARISHTQADEINFMRRWLVSRGEPVEMTMPATSGSHSHGGHSAGQDMLMPGMLSKKQMDALANAKGVEFDRLFLSGMIQHHGGALVMVRELIDTAGAAQDAELFNFVTDVDSGQRAEIKLMEAMIATIK